MKTKLPNSLTIFIINVLFSRKINTVHLILQSCFLINMINLKNKITRNRHFPQMPHAIS